MKSPFKAIRERLLLTQEEFGRGIGVSRVSVWSYECRGRVPRYEIMKAIIGLAASRGLDVTIDDFYSGAEGNKLPTETVDNLVYKSQ